MKKQLQESQQKLIGHIQQKLEMLRRQRKNLQPKSRQQPNNPTQIATSLSLNKEQKKQVQMKLNKLQALYEAKKELRNAGIQVNNVHDLIKFKQPSMAGFLDRRRKALVEEQRKKEIIEQQLENAKQFLKNKKISNKVLASLQQMHYRILLQENKQKLKAFMDLVTKPTLTRVQKQQLINMSFSMLKQWNNLVPKQKLQQFLLANPEFSHHFHITHNQITRDLSVHPCSTPNSLTLLQLTQFLKSIQLTNLHFLPTAKNKQGKLAVEKLIHNLVTGPAENADVNQGNQKDKGASDREKFRALLEYARKSFRELDRGGEGLVERAKFVIMVNRNANNLKIIDLETVNKFANYISQKTKQKCSKNFYKQLDSKYISFTQIQSLCKQFRQVQLTPTAPNPTKKEAYQSINQETNQNQKQDKNDEQSNTDQQSQNISQILLSKEQGKIITSNDYQRYGWNHQEDEGRRGVCLRDLDQYYGRVRDKYQGDIVWAGVEVYKPDFKQLQAFIRWQQDKIHGNSHQQSHKNCQQPNKSP